MPAVLFDLDGTLVDTAHLHTIAWWRAFDDEGEHAPMSAIHRCAGMPAAPLMMELIGRVDDAIAKRHAAHFADMRHLVRPLPGARDVLRKVRDNGAMVLVVTSAEEEDLSYLLEVLSCDSLINAVMAADPERVDTPAPYAAALSRAGCTATESLAVTDGAYDVRCAVDAGLEVIGVRTGASCADELAAAGALASYETFDEALDLWATSALARLLHGGDTAAALAASDAASESPAVIAAEHGPEVTMLLKTEHERIRRLLAEVPGAGSPAAVRESLRVLAARMSRHEAAEELAVYPVLRRLETGPALRKQALAEERELKRQLLRVLRRSIWRPRGRAVLTELEQLDEMLAAHTDFEESQIFPLLETTQSAQKLQMMGAWVSHAKSVAPTHPHPAVPQQAPVLAFATPILAFSDRARDRLRRLVVRATTKT